MNLKMMLVTSFPVLDVKIELIFPIWPYHGVEDSIPSELKICIGIMFSCISVVCIMSKFQRQYLNLEW